jgi:hypothetical protein
LWTPSPWGGVFAVSFWLFDQRDLYTFDYAGRWTLLSGLTILATGLVLLSSYLRPGPSKQLRLGFLCAVTIGGLALAQYKSAIIFVILALALFCSRCVAEFIHGGNARLREIARMTCGLLAVALLASFLAAPRLHDVMVAKTGRYLRHIVLDSPPADSSAFDRPKLKGPEILRTEFATWRRAILSGLALLTVLAAAVWRPGALWFVAGWAVVCVVMNPTLVGIDRVGLIDESHWLLALPTVFAVLAGLGIGFVCERAGRTQSLFWNSLLLAAVAALSLWEAARQKPLPESCRYVLPEDVRLMAWIEQNVPKGETIAGRSFFEHGQPLGMDAVTWLPYFTQHQTNQTNLAASLEQAPSDQREKSRAFTHELYARDMSTVESAHWMGGKGFGWFYAAAIQPERDQKLLEQISSNPELELVRAEATARLYRVR